MAPNSTDSETNNNNNISFHSRNPQSPFLIALPFFKLPISNFPTPQLPISISNAVDHCSKLLHSLASKNPILNKLLSLSSQFHDTCFQIRCSNYRNRRLVNNHLNFAAVLPGDSVAGLVVANGLQNFLNLYNTLIVCRLVLTWFPNAPPALVAPLSTVCDPYLNVFRGLIPPIGGLDLSPILAFLVLNAFTSTAAALPAELPITEQSKQGLETRLQSTDVTSSQNKWMRRLQGIGSKTSTTAD
ncbi:ylmG homolog protein 2, chloroplastic-like [Vicia villosa]|uniref:ylmG homolog protein 2, chloroplastic-like n=1 Tax=Vicia villosa TaxID=3911 RepID=UPI00273A9130|nr:ylmG homolog protein 2, chloroplastic-like [Vicia villosa]